MAKGKGGRPSKYTKALGERICDGMVSRDEDGRPRPLRDVCAEDANLPCEKTVYSWLVSNEEFLQQYTRARETQAEMSANDIVMIADTEPDLDRAKIRIDARKWHASKIAPKKYSDKMKVEGTGEGGEIVFTYKR